MWEQKEPSRSGGFINQAEARVSSSDSLKESSLKKLSSSLGRETKSTRCLGHFKVNVVETVGSEVNRVIEGETGCMQ